MFPFVKMKRITLFVLLGYLLLISTSSLAAEPAKPKYSIALTPQAASDTYNLKVNDNITFTIQGLKQESGSQALSSVEVSRIWWQYNLAVLEKVGSDKNSITLRLVSPQTTELKIIVDIKNRQFTKTVTIAVKE